MNDSHETIQIGDRIRFSVALLRQIYEEPDHVSIPVEVIEIKIEADGCKWLSLKRIDEKTYVCGAPVERTER